MSPKKALLVLGGEPPTENILNWHHDDADFSVAVDSGWHPFQHAGLIPDILIGDFDSIEQVEEFNFPETVEILNDKNQNKSDFEKAIDYLLSLEVKLKEIVVLGALGGRIDHLLNNFSLICSLPEDVIVTIDSANEWGRRVTSKTPVEIKGQKGATMSLIPMISCKSVVTSGLKWNLLKQDLQWGNFTSLSNICSNDFSEVKLESGNLIVLVQK